MKMSIRCTNEDGKKFPLMTAAVTFNGILVAAFQDNNSSALCIYDMARIEQSSANELSEIDEILGETRIIKKLVDTKASITAKQQIIESKQSIVLDSPSRLVWTYYKLLDFI